MKEVRLAARKVEQIQAHELGLKTDGDDKRKDILNWWFENRNLSPFPNSPLPPNAIFKALGILRDKIEVMEDEPIPFILTTRLFPW